jgi:filamentous hemagglutinin family protein
LLQSVSVSALVVAASARPAEAAPFRSLSQALASHPSAAVTAAQTAGGATAAKAAGLGAQNLANAAARYRSLNDALSGATYSGPAVADGVAPGGLQQAVGASSGGTIWSGANTTLGTQTVNGVHDVTVTQTSSVASLAWSSFNVGAKTKLIFNQSAGGTLANTWIAINSVQSPTLNPSIILGEISAPGKVYILNPNGVLFGAGSQVNVGSLIAAAADIAQAQFTRDTNGVIQSFSLYGSATGTLATSTFTPTFVDASGTGSVVVQAGATIETPAPSGNATGGYVMLLGGHVENDGIIATPQGQTVLAAGNNIVLQPGYSPSGNVTATVIGSQVAVTDSGAGTISGTGTTALGAATNTGIIMADQGDITMVGHLVTQAGVVISTTTVNNRGTVHLLTSNSDTTSAIVLAPGSITEVLPENDGSTALNSQRDADIANSATYNADRRNLPTGPVLNDANTLPDQIGESRIEISTGGSVSVQNGALALAQGGQVAVGGTAIALASGATLDVSGTNANLPASFNDLFVQGIVPYYLRDSAANRTGGLEFSNVYIDERTLVEISSGAYAGNIYTQGGLLEVSGNLGLIGHNIEEWSSLGGQVTLQGAGNGGYPISNVTTPGTVTVSSGATINLTGGTVTYGAGLVKQSYVVTTTGQVYNINTAPGNLVYAGVYNGIVVDHKRWQISDTFSNPLLTPAEIFEPAYTIGRDAGTLTVTAANATLDGTVDAGVTVGTSQTGARPASVTDPFQLAQTVTPLAGAFVLGNYAGGVLNAVGFTSNILVGSGTGGGNAPVVAVLPDSVAGTISIDAAALSNAGFASVTLSAVGTIDIAAPLSLAAGGTLLLSGATVTADADITAHSGAIELTNLYPGFTNGEPVSAKPGSISLAAGGTLDTSGEWTNLALDAGNTTQAGYANGGSVTLIGTGGVDLAAGSVIDVSSGGVLSAAGKLTAANGGSIAVSADILPQDSASVQKAPVVYASQFLGYASGNGGTLALTAPSIVVGAPLSTDGTTTFVAAESLFESGFASYALNGFNGLAVDPGTSIDVTRPIYILANPQVATGQPAASAYSIFLPALFTQVKGGDSLTQRGGASIALASTIDTSAFNGGGGPVTIGLGASIAVDPKQSITVDGYGQVTDLGTLTAHGGTITVANSRYELSPTGNSSNDNQANYVPGLSVWIGPQALVDASGEATVFTDAQGRRFGQAQNGGAIYLGGLGGISASSTLTTYAQVIVRPGAVLNASGADATVDVSNGLQATSILKFDGPVTLAGNGGLIAARSYAGVAFDGTLLAGGAGPGAAGGTLSMRMDPQDLSQLYGLPQSYIASSQILISQDFIPVQAQPDLMPGEVTDADTSQLGRISQAQLSAGGFDTLILSAQNDIAFAGPVALSLARSITLESGIIGNAKAGTAASISAPFVELDGIQASQKEYGGGGEVQRPSGTTGTLTVNADLIDFSDELALGGSLLLPAAVSTANGTSTAQPQYASAYGFTSSTFNSRGDIEFTPGDSGQATVQSSGNVTFRAAQIYPTSSSPATSTNAEVLAGYDPYVDSGKNQLAGGTITVLGLNGAAPAAPYSVGGTLALFADTVVQDGVVRAPEGSLEIGEARTSGDTNLQLTDTVVLGPHSITSVSLDGQTVPYGGTVDGVNYLYDGAPVTVFTPVVAVGAVRFIADPGSAIDLRGGGTLAGAGFIAGRGGSADVNVTPLLNAGSTTGTVTANTTDPVFAIVPGYASDYAPVTPADSAYSAPTPGERISIGAGEVAGLAAGTYTLLPAYYDLLPGAFRVELTPSVVAPGTSQSFGNFTTVAAVTLQTANTGIAGNVPAAALITNGAGVRQLSQYDEETYNTFEVNTAATFDAPRPLLPQDAKTLIVTLNTPTGTIISGDSAISMDAGSLLQTPAKGGYGATMEIITSGNDNGAAALEILGPGETGTQLPSSTGTGTIPTLAVDAATLAALDVPRLVLGGTLTTSSQTPNEVVFSGVASSVVVEPHADLTAGDVLLIAQSNGGSIGVSGGATISTIGENATAYGLAQGYYFNTDQAGGSSPVLEVSGSQVVYTPSHFQAPGAAITVDAGATLDAGGSLNFVGPSGTSVQVGESDISAKYVTLQVADINIGNQSNLAAFARILPAGLVLTFQEFDSLAQNASDVILTAQQGINIIGDLTLLSPTADVVLNTPAIYGYGTETVTENPDGTTTTTIHPGTVDIAAPEVTWSGVSTTGSIYDNGTTVLSATPGGRLSGTLQNGPSTVSLTDASSLTIGGTASAVESNGKTVTVTTSTIDLGYGPDVQAQDQVILDRLALGYTNVTLSATKEITANDQSALTVYSTQPTFGLPGSGGNLTMSAPLITAASGSVLDITAGGTLLANSGAQAPAATRTVTTLGAQIDLTAQSVTTSTAFALPSGGLSVNAQTGIDLAKGTDIDLSGRSTKLFDQTAQSTGGTLLLQAYAGDAGSITESAGATINVSAPGAAAGSISATASGGLVEVNGTLLGSAPSNDAGGSFSVFASALGSGFDAVNAALNAGGFGGLRSFEVATGDITVDQTIKAHTVDIAADSGNVTVLSTIDASGLTPGSISLAAGGNLTLASGAALDAHATGIAVDSYGNPIDADNRAHVTLTSTGGTVILDPGVAINVAYAPGNAQAAADPQGQVVINAPRLPDAANGGSGGLSDVAVQATGPVTVTGASSIDLYAFRSYSPTDANGTIVQNNGTGETAGSNYNAVSPKTGFVGIDQIGLDNAAFMTGVDADGALLDVQLAGLAHYGSTFNVLPGVTIKSATSPANPSLPTNLTISGDLDFALLRYSDPVQYFGIGTTGIIGSGEPGSIVFRASGDLTVNGSVSDGFLPPPGADGGAAGQNLAPYENGWAFLTGKYGGYEPTNADVLLPSSAEAIYLPGTKNQQVNTTVYLVGDNSSASAPTTSFDTTRPISLNYAIIIKPALLKPDVTIPFQINVGGTSSAVPAGGWIATASVTRDGKVIFNAGQLIPAGFTFEKGDVVGAGFVSPVILKTAAYSTDPKDPSQQVIPAGTPFSVFESPAIFLAANVMLPVNAFIPANTHVLFGSYFTNKKGKVVFRDVTEVAYRSEQTLHGNDIQGYLYPLAQLMAPGMLSWSMDFVSGAAPGAANANTVQASSSLNGGVFTAPPATPDQAPGSLLIDDQHYFVNDFSHGNTPVVTAFSVIRTGTGDLSLVSGGDVDQSSLYGIYTSGTQEMLPGGETANAPFDSARQPQSGGQLLPGDKKLSQLIKDLYQAYYPNDGGDVLLAAQGDVTGDIFANSSGSTGVSATDNVGNWLWRQGSTQLGQPTSWWINFGTLVAPLNSEGTLAGTGVQMTGFTGLGALGGGNVTVTIGGDAGQITDRDEHATGHGGLAPANYERGEGLVIAVGGTGRLVGGSATPVTTGGGNVTITIGGVLNPIDAAAYGIGATTGQEGISGELASVNGDVTDIRGNINITAGAIGRIDYQYNSGTSNLYDPRPTDPFAFDNGVPNGGIEVIPGDGTVSITTDRDLVLGGAADPGRVAEQDLTSLKNVATTSGNPDYATQGGYTGFTLWQADTSISLFSNGGNVTPTTLPNQGLPQQLGLVQNDMPTDFRSVYPPTLLLTAVTGDIIYGQDGAPPSTGVGYTQYSLETMPAPNGQVAFLAGGSIIANGYAIDISGANPAGLALPTDPAFTSVINGAAPGTVLSNILPGVGTSQIPLALFAEEADTPTTNVHQFDPDPALFYAAGGDIVNFQTGETIYFGGSSNEAQSSWYIAGKPVWIEAARDIVSTGTRPHDYPNAAAFAVQENQLQEAFSNNGQAVNYYSSGDLFYNPAAGSLSQIIAGRDILSAYAYIGGAGELDVSAGRNLYQAAYSAGTQQVLFFGSLKSLGDNLITGSQLNTSAGAGIDVFAGVGAGGPDYAAFAAQYFNPATQFSFDGNFPTPSIPAGGTTYAYGDNVQFNYAFPLEYSEVQTLLSGGSTLVKPVGSTSGGSGVSVPAGIVSLLKTVQASSAKLPQDQPFSALQLLLWVYDGYRGTALDAPAAYAALPDLARSFLARTAFYMELQASGFDHGSPSSTFYDSYVRGQEAIDTLFPSLTTEQPAGAPPMSYGVPAGYSGTITMYSGTVSSSAGTITTTSGANATFDGGIATLYGGNVNVLDPGGATVFGITGGPAPGNSSGIVTYGSGDINIYALSNVLLGQSRIFTTGGGNIVIWSSDGDINAGIGAKTTVVYNPPLLIYDNAGDITETPPADTSGAGIATLQPLPDVAAGNVNLIAPGGTIDAGEAGIRVSGNLVLAASHVVGTANISVKGSTTGAPSVSVASLGAVEAAGAAAGASTSAAQSQGQHSDTTEAASVIDVEVVSIGGTYDDEKKRRKLGI